MFSSTAVSLLYILTAFVFFKPCFYEPEILLSTCCVSSPYVSKPGQKEPPQNAELQNKSCANNPQTRPRKRKVKAKKKNKFTAVWNHHDESFSFEGFGLMFNTVVFVTSLVNASSSSLICSIAVVLISLRPSPRLPLSCVASLLGHMM